MSVFRAGILSGCLLAFVMPGQAADVKPIVATKLVTAATGGHAEKIEASIKGARNLYLVVNDGGNSFACDWADWMEPVLRGPAGTLKLTDLKWKSAHADWGDVRVNRSAGDTPLSVNGKPVSFGIGTHANSVIHFEIPDGYETFTATAGLDNGGTDQGGASSVRFLVYTQAPPGIGAASAADRKPEDAVAGLDVAEDLELTLFAAEPLLLSPSNIDVDHLGRIWVCEVVNYRRFANGNNPDRAEGDRILVLEDTNGDGMADKETVFYQGRDIDSAHGVCVLGNRVIVSAGDCVFNFYDDNGDLKADRKEKMFTGIKGTQHDHGIHSFLFGPDGRLYFNFGNAGEELHNPDGSIVVDAAGNEVRATRNPYQEGMAFRCEPDGSKVDTLGWNFRNNWELCVDSFGTIWQSDNDDDGNRGVRINYVMEYGNYGYKDQLTGAGWREPRTNLETEIPLQHWHLNDPGVVPNLLQTGAGSPTGILIYEGDQLPDRFRNQLIHCDAGPNVVRSYAVTDDGAGYKAEINDILNGTRDQWFRPSDVCVAPDGSLIVADWYDPGVGGHRQGDVDRGRLFRVALPGQKYDPAKPDFSTIEGAAEALKSPNHATRYLAYQKLRESGAEASSVLTHMFSSDPNPRFRARAMWLLGQIPGRAKQIVEAAISDTDKDIRIAGLRLARRTGVDVLPMITKLVHDKSPQVRRECAIALRHISDSAKVALWTTLARARPPEDRWYLEALGLAADRDAKSGWNACMSQLLKQEPAASVLDLIWRSRGENSVPLKADAISSVAVMPNAANQESQILKLYRSLDFEDKAHVSKVCLTMLSTPALAKLSPKTASLVIVESLARLSASDAADPAASEALARALSESEGTPQFVRLVRRFQTANQYPKLLELAQTHPAEQIGVEAISALLDLKQWSLLMKALTADDTTKAIATAEAMGNSANGAINGPLLTVVKNGDVNAEVRRAAVKAASKVNNGAMELAKLVDEKTLDPELAQAVAAALHSAPSRQAREQAHRLFPLPPSKDNQPTPPISELVTLKGDVANGRLVFFSTGTCHKCHVVDGMGREIGPNLSEIGSKLSLEAMLESVLYPSAGISHNYEGWTVVLTSGTTVTGLLISNTDAEVSIKGDDALIRTFPKSEIDEMVKQKISLMPADLQKTMTSQELADVVAYMQTLKKK